MPVHELEAVFYVSRVPEISYKESAFHIAFEVGKCRFEFAMPPSVFLKSKAIADEARARWQLGQMESGNVSNIRKKK